MFNLKSAYKKGLENISDLILDCINIKIKYLTLFTLSSENIERQSVINIFKRQREEGRPLTITGDGTQRRDFTHVDDIVNGLVLAGDNICNQEFQLGTGEDYSVLEIAAAFDHHFEFIDARRGDRPKGLADTSHARKVLGYEPTVNIIDYIKSLWRFVM